MPKENQSMKLNISLAKIFQLVVSLLFIAIVMFYFGVVLMFPLAVLWYAIKIASLITPTVIAVVIGIAVLASWDLGFHAFLSF
jgi:hypothetical protein